MKKSLAAVAVEALGCQRPQNREGSRAQVRPKHLPAILSLHLADAFGGHRAEVQPEYRHPKKVLALAQGWLILTNQGEVVAIRGVNL